MLAWDGAASGSEVHEYRTRVLAHLEDRDAHVVDERLELASLHKAAQGYHGIIQAALDAKK